MIKLHVDTDGTRYLSYPPPARPWSTNQQVSKHWRVTHPIKKEWRDQATWAAMWAKLGVLEGKWEITMKIPFDRNARRDPHNYIGTLVKWTIDGLVKAGTWPDDTPQYVSVREPELIVGKGKRVTIRMWPMS